MQPREERRKVMVMARMRAGGAWSDVAILDLSRRGLGGQSGTPPAVGTYLEVRRGPNVIVARVVWARRQRFGARCQDRVAIEAFLAEQAVAGSGGSRAIERRTAPREENNGYEASRQAGRALELTGLGVAAVVAAMLAFATVHEALAKPLALVSAAMS